MKRIYWIILSAAALLGIAACTQTNDPLEAAREDDSATTRVVIREILTIETDTVGTLAEKIGDQRETVQKLIISGPIDATDVETFRNLPALLAIDLKDATICGGDSTYHYPGGYGSDIKLEDNVIGEYMFSSTNLSEIVLPDNITGIKYRAFYDLDGSSVNPFASIVIPEGISTINDATFLGCNNLKTVTLPSTIRDINFQAFGGCTSLESINLDEVEAIGQAAFEHCASLKTLTLPETLGSLGDYCFQGSGLTSIDLPRSIAVYGKSIFRSCTSLQSVTFPDNMETIPGYMFDGCQSLDNVVIPESVHTINDSAFSGCASLSNITLPQQLTLIRDAAFNGCTHLTQIELPASLTSIYALAFGNTGLTSIEIPESVETIGGACFEHCRNLTTVIFHSTAEEFNFPEAVFRYCSALEHITLPENTVSFGNNCFQSCTSLKDIDWPTQLKLIGVAAFENTAFSQVILPDQLETLSVGAFYGCENLTTATVPASVTAVGSIVFFNCCNLTSIFWNTETAVPSELCGSIFYMNPNVLLYLSNSNTQVQDSNLHNIILDGMADEITLVSDANSPFFVPQEFRAVHVTYSRDFTYPTYPGEASGWQSISLPFTVDDITGPAGQTLAPFNADVADAKPFWLRRLTENGFENVTQIEAGVPYIIAMPNNEAYDDEYNISGTVTFTASNSAGVLFPDSLEMTQDVGPAFIFNASYSYHPASTAIYALNEENTNYYAGSRFVRNERGVLPFEGYVSNSVITSNAPRYYDIDAGRPATRAARPLGPVPSIDDM